MNIKLENDMQPDDTDTAVINNTSDVRGRYDIKKLVSQIPDDYQVKEVDWGLPVGAEVW